jgi:hypothetical protein
MPVPHPCAQPLRLEPKFFFIRGPFHYGASLLVVTAGSLFVGVALLALTVINRDSSGWWWRLGLMIVPPLTHYHILKKYVEDAPPHRLEDAMRWALRLKLSNLAFFPTFFPLVPLPVPDDEMTVWAGTLPRLPGQPARPYDLDADQFLSTHPYLRMKDSES